MKLFVLLPSVVCALFARTSDEESRNYDHLRESVVRIQAVNRYFDWMVPYTLKYDSVGVGSGFVVQTDPYPLFVTNAHVVTDAKQVTLQLLLFGEQEWDADVVAICQKFDLALLVLRDPSKFNHALRQQNISLASLHISEKVVTMGEDVLALGFPLGQNTLKISKGNIAGNEEVDENLCIQSTAPISPGNSGGPLLNAEATSVVGVNFAKATSGENMNFVIPAWRVSQIIRKHLKDQPDYHEGMEWKRVQVNVPKLQLVTVESNDALFSMSKTCHQGIYISKVRESSLFRQASPPVEENSFLVSVNGHEVDRFGRGVNPDFSADRVKFPDLVFMVPSLASNVTFTTCSQSKGVVEHGVSLDYDELTRERGLRWVDEPYWENTHKKFEYFGGVVVMEMTVNHVSVVVNDYYDPGPSRWLHPSLIDQPRLMVTYVDPGSYASNVIREGAAVSSVNGHKVSTLDEYREHFVPVDSDVWILETDMSQVLTAMFNETLQVQVGEAVSAPHLFTQAVEMASMRFNSSASTAPRQLRGMPSDKRQTLLGIKQDKPRAQRPAELNTRAAGPVLASKQGRVRTTRGKAIMDV